MSSRSRLARRIVQRSSRKALSISTEEAGPDPMNNQVEKHYQSAYHRRHQRLLFAGECVK